jgi:hypothetical protein
MMDLVRSHTAAWRLGRSHFDYTGDPPQPRGLLIGEAPGPHTNARLPLFPEPTNSAAARLLKYADIEPVEWMGKLMRMNMCDGPWSERRATAGRARALTYLLDEANYCNGKPLRVLLLGARVACAWACHGPFGHVIHKYAERRYQRPLRLPNLHIAWIPHPSGRNLIYNDRKNQLRARNAVLWAIGERAKP